MNKIVKLYQWTTSIPLLAFILYLSGLLDNNPVFQIIAGVLLMLCVMSAVHHSEIVAHRVVNMPQKVRHYLGHFLWKEK